MAGRVQNLKPSPNGLRKVKEQVEVDLSQHIVQQLQAGRLRVLEGLSQAELQDRI